MANRDDEQDYGRRGGRYDEQRRRGGSGRENTQGGSTDYNRDGETGYYGASSNRDTNSTGQGFGGSGFQSGYFGSDFGRGYDQQDRDYDDFASTIRPGGNYTGDFGRNTGRDRNDDLRYGFDRDTQYADRSGDQGGYGERREDYDRSRSNYDNRQDQQTRGENQNRYNEEQRDRQSYGGGQGFYGKSGGYTGSSEQGYDTSRNENKRHGEARSEQEERGILEKTTDSLAAWFGDEDAAARRREDTRESDYNRYQNQRLSEQQQQQQQANHRGRGPKNYRRSDERIKEEINDRLTDYPYLDASHVDVEVANGEVVLTGTVESRAAKRMAEDIAENVSGVGHLENRLRVQNQNQQSGSYQTEQSRQNQAGYQNQPTDVSKKADDSTGTYGSREDLAANFSNAGLAQAGTAVNTPERSLTNTTGATVGSNAGTMAAENMSIATETGDDATNDFGTTDSKND